MKLRQRLQDDNSAVSPVIGVILMVAITVILAAVIASFVLGLGPDTATTPTATFSSEEDSGVLTITMESGEALDPGKVYIRGDIDTSPADNQVTNTDGQSWADSGASPGNEITAGDSIKVGVSGDYTIRLIYEEGDTSSTMQTFEA